MNPATVRQATPIPNDQPSAHDLVCADLKTRVSEKYSALLIADLTARRDMGREKYGTLLQANNGRDVMIDAYQEALDLIAYLRQALEEGKPVSALYRDTLALLVSLRARMGSEHAR